MRRMEHIDAHLVGTDVRHDGDLYRITAVQGRWAVLVRLADGWAKHVAIVDIVGY
ncbi:hypothetical protein [Streptomyces sp. NPDC059165]|uniref:hypothetical protein n=1 Tax=Streptomyces sp. NPDC059165 TaxID=3346751 RepID=UPI003698C682